MKTKVAEFSKVSYGQWEKDIRKITDAITEDGVVDLYNQIKLPRRATTGSAGYDIYATYGFTLAPGDSILIPTGIRCDIDEGWFLAIYPRSGLGFKYYCRLANTTGVIDEDYAFSDNEGHIMVKLRNEGDKDLTINRGDGIAQGILQPYGITYNDNADGVRNGGFGSTGGAQ